MSHALERVKIPRLGRSLPAAAIICFALPVVAYAQDASPDAATHTVKRGDTLWDLAQSYLGDAYLWPEIYRLNTDQIDDPHWIYPGEILRLPGGAPKDATAVAEPPRRVAAPTVFASRVRTHSSLAAQSAKPRARVPFGDVKSAPYIDAAHGPHGSGRIMFGADIPGIDTPRATSNYQLYDKLLIVPPAGSAANVRDLFVAYTLSNDIEDVGTVVVPNALLQVVRAPQNGEAAVVQVLELYGELNADDHIVPFDAAGAGATAVPVPVAAMDAPSTTIRAIHRAADLPSLNYFVMFNLSANDGMKIGDEVEIYREREIPKGDDGPILPEVAIATGQVVRVTPYGATARITTQDQPAIKLGEHVRVTARMP